MAGCSPGPFHIFEGSDKGGGLVRAKAKRMYPGDGPSVAQQCPCPLEINNDMRQCERTTG